MRNIQKKYFPARCKLTDFLHTRQFHQMRPGNVIFDFTTQTYGNNADGVEEFLCYFCHNSWKKSLSSSIFWFVQKSINNCSSRISFLFSGNLFPVQKCVNTTSDGCLSKVVGQHGGPTFRPRAGLDGEDVGHMDWHQLQDCRWWSTDLT